LLQHRATFAAEVFLEAAAFAALVLLPALARLGELRLHGGRRLVGYALGLALGLGQACLGAALRFRLHLGILAALEEVGGRGAHDDAEEENQQSGKKSVHAAPSSRSSLRSSSLVLFLPPAP